MTQPIFGGFSPQAAPQNVPQGYAPPQAVAQPAPVQFSAPAPQAQPGSPAARFAAQPVFDSTLNNVSLTGGNTPQIRIGQHKLELLSLRYRNMVRKAGTMFEADFLVLDSSVQAEVGQRRRFFITWDSPLYKDMSDRKMLEFFVALLGLHKDSPQLKELQAGVRRPDGQPFAGSPDGLVRITDLVNEACTHGTVGPQTVGAELVQLIGRQIVCYGTQSKNRQGQPKFDENNEPYVNCSWQPA